LKAVQFSYEKTALFSENPVISLKSDAE
jgi:hypothetical protein